MRFKKSTTSTIVIITIITFFARIFGFLREVLIAEVYGASIYTDAYIIANNIPTVLFETAGTALLTSFIPMYSKAKSEQGKQVADHFVWKLTIILFALCSVLTILAELFTRQVVLIFATGFKGEALELAISFSRILFPSIYAMTLIKLYAGYLQIYENYITAALMTIVGNLFIIATLIISALLNNVYFFVYGSLLGIFAQVFLVLPQIIRLGLFNNIRNLRCHNEYIYQLLPLLLPVFLGSAIHEINSVVDRSMVSGLESGAVSTLNYGYKMISLAISVIAMPIINVMYPRLSKAYAQKELSTCRMISLKYTNVMMFIMIPVCVMFIMFRNEIIYIMFQRGSFDETATLRTSKALGCYAIGLVAMAVQQVEIRIFYSAQNTFIPMLTSAFCSAINIGLDYYLIHSIGFSGAAIATSLVAIFGLIILSTALLKREMLPKRGFFRIVLKNGTSAIVLLVVTWLLYSLIGTEYSFMYFVKAFFAVAFGLVSYLIMEIILNNQDIINVISSFIQRLKRKKGTIS